MGGTLPTCIFPTSAYDFEGATNSTNIDGAQVLD